MCPRCRHNSKRPRLYYAVARQHVHLAARQVPARRHQARLAWHHQRTRLARDLSQG
jgi:hypothetical protein